MADEPESIEDVLDCVEGAGEGEARVSVSDIVDRIGEEAFAPLLLAAALIVISPASAVPGLSSVCGAIIALIALQMAAGREKLWLPGFIRDRTVSSRRLDHVVNFLSKPARLVDSLTRKRLSLLASPPLDRVWALLCATAALFMPFFELVPMSATVLASAIGLFALAMVAKDGLFVVFGLTVMGGAGWLLSNVF